jgi:hypothetical protein
VRGISFQPIAQFSVHLGLHSVKMGERHAQYELGNHAGVEKFFAGREALIAREKEQRSGK